MLESGSRSNWSMSAPRKSGRSPPSNGFRLLDRDYGDYILGLDRDTTLVFQCHHGIRSQAAAEYCVEKGFRNVYNVVGGIDAWSLTVDRSVPRY